MEQTRSYKAQQFIDRLPKKLSRQLVGSLVGCVHCGMCTESCHYVLANPDDPTYAPAYKADKLRQVFKRHIDWTGRVFPWWVHAKTVTTDEELEELKDIAFGKCTNCRRCTINCPMGVDFATANRVMRGLLVHCGVMPEGVAVVSKDQWEIGNQMGVLKEDYIDTIEWMSEELVDDVEDEAAAIPIDKEDADVVYSINPREVKYDPRSISDAAKIFWAAGENWTMPSEGWDMTNFGLFSGDDDLGGAVARRILDKFPDGSKERRYTHIIVDETAKLENILQNLLLFSRGAERPLEPLDIRGTIERILDAVFEKAGSTGITIVKELLPKHPIVLGDPPQIDLVFLNIFTNTREAMGESGSLTVRTTNRSDDPDRPLWIEVSDTAGGMSQEVVENLFNPFFTTKHWGTGLGLSTALRIVENHCGRLEVVNRPGSGVTFLIKLPVAGS